MQWPDGWDDSGRINAAVKEVNRYQFRIRLLYVLGLFCFVFGVTVGSIFFLGDFQFQPTVASFFEILVGICIPGFLGIWAADFATNRYFRYRHYEPELFVKHYRDRDVTLEFLPDGDAVLKGYVADGKAMHYQGEFGKIPGSMARFILEVDAGRRRVSA